MRVACRLPELTSRAVPSQVPGSHQGHIKLPAEWGDMSSAHASEWGDAPWLYKVPAEAGDAIV